MYTLSLQSYINWQSKVPWAATTSLKHAWPIYRPGRESWPCPKAPRRSLLPFRRPRQQPGTWLPVPRSASPPGSPPSQKVIFHLRKQKNGKIFLSSACLSSYQIIEHTYIEVNVYKVFIVCFCMNSGFAATDSGCVSSSKQGIDRIIVWKWSRSSKIFN